MQAICSIFLIMRLQSTYALGANPFNHTFAPLISQHQLKQAKPNLCPRIQVSRTVCTVVLMWLICNLSPLLMPY